ncbi:aldo/keto reductase [Alicyclobacillus fastidiosus]|uniref:Aldo/keto reductase n=1 Tax=Alicyclobacillus fastidiosus TaxID=392011 RepID=A0ABY6ZAU4_9BACL|nr:aldo/keto reductase [Alicyclobacillus fastidiosus]WAH39652.1 aldo/keto reductase [Alicyclobacillus fastidiosus]GMA60860.1 glyoxal reductase [Alicyclobacillus fastidiosus]
MVSQIFQTTKLNNGVEMPWFGLGVYKAQAGAEVEQAIHDALEIGYRHIDTAALYENEESVGEAIRTSGLKREDVFVTTKLWNTEQGYESTLKAFETSRKKLKFDYIDLYLIHWPGKDKFVDTWKAFEKLYRDGYIRAIGVSNFQVHHLQTLLERTEIRPTVNQVEYHPRLTQEPLKAFCESQQIQLEAWAPLMRGKVLDDPVILDIAAKYGKTPSQVVLRWDLDTKVITIPKSVHRNRIEENAGIFDFQLDDTDLKRIGQLNTNERTGPDPDELLF